LREESFPRIVVGGLSGDSGKTLVSLGLALAARARGLEVQGFKKGPDYIDAAWLSWATGRPGCNLDTWMAGFEGAALRFRRSALAEGLNLIEGNRGLFDGVDSDGKYSTAGLARTLAAPVLLVVSARKTTTTAAALVLGCQRMDPAVSIAGVILNHVAGSRHETITREAIERACGIPVLGAIPRMETEGGEAAPLLPGRHLGLVTPSEHPDAGALAGRLTALIGGHVDAERVLEIARLAPALEPAPEEPKRSGPTLARPLVVGYLRDSAFSFYYPENLEALEALGARLVPVSSLQAPALPPGLHALYIGGGFPETHAPRIAANRGLLASIAGEAARGLPIYAECGGLMLLARTMEWRGEHHRMAGVLPFDIEVLDRPQGHGYSLLRVDRPNPFFAVGTTLRGHEFHYSKIVDGSGSRVEGHEDSWQWREAEPGTCAAVQRGTGCGGGRDGFVINNVWASYTHLHADGSPEWAPAVIEAAGRFAAGER
jgi:cobyrinic acid a,c-diamide synthase